MLHLKHSQVVPRFFSSDGPGVGSSSLTQLMGFAFPLSDIKRKPIHLLTCYFDVLRCFTTCLKKSTWQPSCWKPCCCQASLKYHLPTTCWAQLRPNLSPQHMLHHSNPVVSGFLWPYLWSVDTLLVQAVGNPLEMQWELIDLSFSPMPPAELLKQSFASLLAETGTTYCRLTMMMLIESHE